MLTPDRLRYSRSILFFELFPAFVTIVAVIAGVALYVANRSARNHEPDTTNPEPNTEHEPGSGNSEL